MCRRMPSFNSLSARARGVPRKITRWMSSDEYWPTRRTTMLSPSSSHSSTDPGPTPSLRLTSAGTAIWPCAVSFDFASATAHITMVMTIALSPGRVRHDHHPAAVAFHVHAREAKGASRGPALVLHLRVANARGDRRVAIDPHGEVVLLNVGEELPIAGLEVGEIFRFGVDRAVAVGDGPLVV